MINNRSKIKKLILKIWRNGAKLEIDILRYEKFIKLF
jgi:hypothetical protein